MIKVRAVSAKVAEILIMDIIGEDFWSGGGVTATKVKDQLDALGDVEEISVRINSPGGNVWDGIAIYNLLKQSEATINVRVEALAASAASIIAMAGDKIVMAEGAMLMIHNPASLAWGESEDMRKVADMLDKVQGELAGIYAARSGASRKSMIAAMNVETWYTGPEAVDAGLADETAVQTSEPLESEADAKAWAPILTCFRHVPGKIAETASVPRVTISARRPDLLSVAAMAKGLPKPEARHIVPATPAPQERPTMTEEEIRAKALADDKARREAIRAVFSSFAKRATEPHTKAVADLLATCVEDAAISVDGARTKLLDLIGVQNVDVKAIGGDTVVSIKDARDKFVEGAGKALLMRAGMEKREVGNEFYGRSLCDLAEIALRATGVSCSGLTKDGIARKVLASHTSSDFPLLLANAAGKVLRAAYALVPTTWQTWCKIGSVPDFKAASRLTLGSFTSLTLKPEGGEYKQGTLSEEREPITAKTKGRFIQMSREMIVNDDLGAFAGLARKMGQAAARTVEIDVYALLTSASGAGPTMSDTGAFFNATAQTTAGGHANLTASGTAISTASLGVGEALMAAQKDKGLNEFIMVRPRILLVSPTKKQIAWDVVNSVTDISQANPLKKNYANSLNLTVVCSNFLSGNPWYLMTDPNEIETFEVAFLDGVQEPFIDEEVEFMTDAMNMKVRLDYGIAAIDWRGGYRNAGA